MAGAAAERGDGQRCGACEPHDNSRRARTYKNAAGFEKVDLLNKNYFVFVSRLVNLVLPRLRFLSAMMAIYGFDLDMFPFLFP